MYRSSSFIKQCHRLDSPDRALEELFLRHLPRLPRGIGLELYAHATQSDRGSDPEQLHQLLADMVDLLWMEYDDKANPLTREDWEILRDLIDEHAQELDLNLVQYVMERVVSNRAL